MCDTDTQPQRNHQRFRELAAGYKPHRKHIHILMVPQRQEISKLQEIAATVFTRNHSLATFCREGVVCMKQTFVD